MGFLIAVSVVSGCAAPSGGPTARPSTAARFDLDRDAFAFPNLVRAERPETNGAFANYCIVMVRAASQFFRFARFHPDRAALAPGAYGPLVTEVLGRPPWEPPAPEALRVAFPGHADLRAFSLSHEATVKAAFGGNVASMMHWRTWRVGLAQSEAHQAGLAQELVAEIDGGRPAPLMITNFPHEDLLNHAVLVYDYRTHAAGLDFLAYDPNDPGTPLRLHFDPAGRRFWVGLLTYSPPGPIRAFRLFASPLL